VTLSERLCTATPDEAIAHLLARGWARAADADHEALGKMACLTRATASAAIDHTAVPLAVKTPEQRLALAHALAASAQRDGLDLAKLATSLGL